MVEILLLLLRTLITSLRSRRDVTLENLVLRHQLHVALRTDPTPRLKNRDRVLWVWVRLLWPERWRQHLLLVQPETVLRWHRKGWRCTGVGSHGPDSAARDSATRSGISSPGSPRRTGSGVPSVFGANCSSWGLSSVIARSADTGGASRRAAGPRNGGLSSPISSRASGQLIC